jgi:hypothetical protein
MLFYSSTTNGQSKHQILILVTCILLFLNCMILYTLIMIGVKGLASHQIAVKAV